MIHGLLAMDEVPRDLRAEDFATQDPSYLTRPGGAFFSYAKHMGTRDFSGLAPCMRRDHASYPVFVNSDLTLFLEAWDHDLQSASGSASASGDPGLDWSTRAIQEDLLTIAEPKSRPDLFHAYAITAQVRYSST